MCVESGYDVRRSGGSHRAILIRLMAATEQANAVLAKGKSGLRNELFAHAVRVGVARRTSDISALAETWLAARGVLPGHSVDLYSLLPLGELAVAAARLRDGHRVRPQLEAAAALLDALDNPPLWSATFHWYGVQAAILAEHPPDLIPHADALVSAARISRHAGLLARAGQTWLRILQEDVDPDAVRQAVQDLDGIGLSWDASRLAAQAAARTTDRQDMLDLLHAARSSSDSLRLVQRAPRSTVAEPAASSPTANGRSPATSCKASATARSGSACSSLPRPSSTTSPAFDGVSVPRTARTCWRP